MSLGNMRENGVRSIELFCVCGHHAIANVDRFPDHLLVPDMRLRFRCTHCGERPQSTRPNIREWGKYR